MAAYASRTKSAARFAKKAVPIGMELYRRWQALTPQQRERYMNNVKAFAAKAGETAKKTTKPSVKKRKY